MDFTRKIRKNRMMKPCCSTVCEMSHFEMSKNLQVLPKEQNKRNQSENAKLRKKQADKDSRERREIESLRERERHVEMCGSSGPEKYIVPISHFDLSRPTDRPMETVIEESVLSRRRAEEARNEQKHNEPLIDSNRKPIKLNIQAFKHGLHKSARQSNADEKLLLDNEHWMNLDNINSDDHKCPDGYFEPDTGQVLTMNVYRCPFVQAVIYSNSDRFFDLVIKNMNTIGRFCNQSCFCKQGRKNNLPHDKSNLLHFAAAYSTREFLERVTLEKFYRREIERRLRKQPKVDQTTVNFWISHYRDTIDQYQKDPHGNERLIPSEVAAEEGRLDIVEVFLETSLSKSLANLKASATSKYCSFLQYRHWCYGSLLSRLVENGILHELSEKHLLRVFAYITTDNFLHAADTALAKGYGEALDILERLGVGFKSVYASKQYTQYSDPNTRNNDIPGIISSDGNELFKRCDSSQPAHILAQYGHFKLFDKLTVEEKNDTDFHRVSALIELLEFSDDEVRSQLRFFRNIRRDNIFLFISQVIIRNRIGLLEDALQLAFTNSNNFTPINTRKLIYKDYGTPEHIALPMETALQRTGNMDTVEQIAKYYTKTDRHARKMIEEDALRCIRSIQNRARVCTEHLRLSIIFMMIKFVDPFSPKFRNILRMYLDQAMNDNVSQYVLKSFSMIRSKRFLSKQSFVTWSTAVNEAFQIVSQWNGSLEEADFVPKFLSETKKCGAQMFFPKQEFRSLLLTEEKRTEKKKYQAERRPRTEDDVMSKLAKAIEDFENLNL
ncbi:ANK_REP_REGION domain-containing protein [Caenorhabditis elegans]|uniref:ANK_REP_REGION domain-containing protein n=1 Tax=Caenorhabditis elegans TaxID=6239 RepID=Q9BI64_CAEEL|nr:ANK_REP_REGION domain-containing protein [Caenorhabditis elegans]CCD63786.2 ANK_REP_REGION domain-containing protein [Caenorhabditis elegans]|eukprot:NP_001343615.1 Uncharacterized protein CELE_F45E4.10 [Caenorhabditis elegans]